MCDLERLAGEEKKKTQEGLRFSLSPALVRCVDINFVMQLRS